MAMTAEFVLFIAIIKLLSPRRLFTYFKRRYSRSQVEILNDVLRKRYVARNISHNIIFLKRCKENGVCPTSIQKRGHKARAYHSLAIERVFLKDDIARSTDTLCSVKSQF